MRKAVAEIHNLETLRPWRTLTSAWDSRRMWPTYTISMFMNNADPKSTLWKVSRETFFCIVLPLFAISWLVFDSGDRVTMTVLVLGLSFRLHDIGLGGMSAFFTAFGVTVVGLVGSGMIDAEMFPNAIVDPGQAVFAVSALLIAAIGLWPSERERASG